jgi:hypothetical protein
MRVLMIDFAMALVIVGAFSGAFWRSFCTLEASRPPSPIRFSSGAREGAAASLVVVEVEAAALCYARRSLTRAGRTP